METELIKIAGANLPTNGISSTITELAFPPELVKEMAKNISENYIPKKSNFLKLSFKLFGFLLLFLIMIPVIVLLYISITYGIEKLIRIIWPEKKEEYDTKTYKNWMEELSKNDDITIKNLVIPGTHNSSSYKLNQRNYLGESMIYDIMSKMHIFDYIIEKWTLNNDSSVLDQLKRGIRWLDVDVYKNGSEYYAAHEFENCKIKDIMGQVKDFMNDTKEIVFLSFTPRDMIKKDIEKFYNHIGNDYEDIINKDFKSGEYKKILENSLKELIDLDKRLFIISNIMNKNTYYMANMVEEMDYINSNIEKKSYNACNSQIAKWGDMDGIKAYRIPWTLTGNLWDALFTGICQSCESGTKVQSKRINKLLDNFLDKHDSKLKRGLILTFDFPTNKNIEQIIEINKS